MQSPYYTSDFTDLCADIRRQFAGQLPGHATLSIGVGTFRALHVDPNNDMRSVVWRMSDDLYNQQNDQVPLAIESFGGHDCIRVYISRMKSVGWNDLFSKKPLDLVIGVYIIGTDEIIWQANHAHLKELSRTPIYGRQGYWLNNLINHYSLGSQTEKNIIISVWLVCFLGALLQLGWLGLIIPPLALYGFWLTDSWIMTNKNRFITNEEAEALIYSIMETVSAGMKKQRYPPTAETGRL